MRVIDLDDIKISPRVQQSWLGYLPLAIVDLKSKYPNLETREIPDEQFREFPDGSGEIFVNVRGKKLSLKVKKEEWVYL